MQTEADRWRKAAAEALGKLSKIMDFFLWASAQLVELTHIHTPDDFSHCTVCGEPWPCKTTKIVKSIGERFAALQREEDNGD